MKLDVIFSHFKKLNLVYLSISSLHLAVNSNFSKIPFRNCFNYFHHLALHFPAYFYLEIGAGNAYQTEALGQKERQIKSCTFTMLTGGGCYENEFKFLFVCFLNELFTSSPVS